MRLGTFRKRLCTPLILLLFSFGAQAEPPSWPGVTVSQDTVDVNTIEGTKMVRQYILGVPEGLEAGKTYPLIVAFHGYRGDVKTWFYQESAFGPLIAKEKFIIAYPEGPIGWEGIPNGPDVIFFDTLVATLEKKYPVDPSRVYVIGHSNGAVFASYLLLSRPKTVAGGVAASGIFPARPFPEKVTHSPLMVIWGEKDHMAPAGSDWVQLMIFGYKEKQVPVETIFIPDGGHPWPDAKNHIEEKILAFLFAHRLSPPVAPAK